MEDMDLRRRIAGEVLGTIEEGGFCRCPGALHHTGRTARKDCRVRLDGAPTIYCVHTSCASAVEEANHTLRSRIAGAERAAERGESVRGPSGLEGCAMPPREEEAPRIPPYQPDKLAAFAADCRRPVSLDWLAERSPAAIPAVQEQVAEGRATARLFLDSVYPAAARVLIFTRYFSQGDFLHTAGGESVRLGEKPGVDSVPSALPSGGREGVWFLTAPVTGEWSLIQDDDAPRMGRRHAGCVTSFPFLLLESDTAPEDLWLRALVLLRLPIVALYTSGGKSIHALVRVGVDSKPAFDSLRDFSRAALCPLGADGAAMTAVRLSRLPGCLRMGQEKGGTYLRFQTPRLQRLVYLNPQPPEGQCILDFVK